MNADSVGNTLAAHFTAQMAALEVAVQVVYDNGPKLTVAPNPASGEWVRYSWRPADDRAAAIGGRLYRGVGVVDVQVFTSLGNGAGASERIGRTIQTLFRDQTIAGVFVRGISFANIGETDGWYQTQIRAQIVADESL